MQNPDIVLGIIESKAKETDYKFDRLYRNFYNIEFYKMAYAKIYAKPGNMTAGTDGKTIDGFNLKEVQHVIEAMKSEAYEPRPVRRKLIEKKNSTKMRPLGIPAFYDKLVQEILRSLLEAIYEPNFPDNSHGYRPSKSCHTALIQVKTSFTGVKWWVEGDIKGFFDNINHHVLINILKRKIGDEKLIRLIWKFLRAGYTWEGALHNTYGGTPQGGIVSPILANIYLNELDSEMKKAMEDFNTKKRQRRANPEYKRLSQKIEDKKKLLKEPLEEELTLLRAEETKILAERDAYARSLPPGTIRRTDTTYKNVYSRRLYRLRLKMRTLTKGERKSLIAEIKSLTAQRRLLPSMDNFDPDFKRMKYVRYADDFLVGIVGTKDDALSLKNHLTEYLKDHLDLELSQEKTFVTHNSEKVRFLGYDIFIAQPSKNYGRIMKVEHNNGESVKKRTNVGGIKLSIPHDALKNFIVGKGYAKDLGTGKWKEKHRPEMRNNEPLEIIRQSNAEFRGFYQYYKLAFDVRIKLLDAHWLWRKSVTKTLAGKYKTKISKLMNMEIEFKGRKLKKFYRNGKWGIAYIDKNGIEKFDYLMSADEIQMEKVVYETDPTINAIPNTVHYGRTSIIKRLNANRCEKCGDTNGPFEVHHVRKLSDLSKKKNLQSWEKFMIARNRKTLVLCGNRSKNNCHLKLHNGKL